MAGPGRNVIEISGLNKSFGDVKAVSDLSFSVREGELFAFLGVNGAGKSTTINMICGQLKRDAGEITVCGESIDRGMSHIAEKIGVVFQNSVLDQPLTVMDNLKSRAALYGISGEDFRKRLGELSGLLGLEPLLKRPVGKLSGGQRRRIDIARALIHEPEILILDEPTTGLDPQTRKNIWSVVHELRVKEKMTVFLTTHYMEETADADNIIVIDHGKIAAEGTPLDLKNRYAGDYITFYNAEADEDEIRGLGLPVDRVGSGVYRLKVSGSKEAAGLVCSRPDLFKDFEITKGKMDDVFLAITGEQLTGDEK